MPCSPGLKEGRVGVGDVVRPMFILQGSVDSTCPRRVRTGDKGVSRWECVKQEGGRIVSVNAVGPHHRRSRPRFNVHAMV